MNLAFFEATNSTGGSSVLGPQADYWLHWLFGAGWWMWLVFASIVGGIALRAQFKKMVTKVETPAQGIPDAIAYSTFEKQNMEEGLPIEDMEFERRRQEEWGRMLIVPRGTTVPEGNGQAPSVDPNTLRIMAAFDGVKQKMYDRFVDAINKLEVKVTLPEEGPPQITMTAPPPTPPDED